jgi:glycine/D-amino acid oxidase-like deaminating enzyme
VIERVDVVVIGAGGLGAATAFALARRSDLQVALVDKYEIGSQTSPRAAGMVSYMRKSDLMIELVKLAGMRSDRSPTTPGSHSTQWHRGV